MRLHLRILGLDVIDLELTTATATYEAAEEYDPATALTGGTLGAYPIDAGPTDRYMGFTSGLEYGDE